MSKFETVAVPFLTLGNRHVLTALQAAQEPWIGGFIQAFPACFEKDHQRDIWIYYPDGDAPLVNGANLSE